MGLQLSGSAKGHGCSGALSWHGSWGLGGWHRDVHPPPKATAITCSELQIPQQTSPSKSFHLIPCWSEQPLCCAHSHHFVQYNLHHQPLHFYSSFIFTHPTEVKRCFSPGKRQHLIPRPPGTQRQDLCSSLLQLAGAPYLEPQSPALIGMRTLYSISLSSCWHCLLVWMLQVTV